MQDTHKNSCNDLYMLNISLTTILFSLLTQINAPHSPDATEDSELSIREDEILVCWDVGGSSKMALIQAL